MKHIKRIVFALVFIAFLINLSSRNYTVTRKEYNAKSMVDTANKDNLFDILTDFGSKLDAPIVNTNKFACSITNGTTTCDSTPFYDIGVISYSEYNAIGGNNSYLYSNTPYFVLSGAAVSVLTPSGLSDSYTSHLRPSIYIQQDNRIKGSGTASDPYIISNEICLELANSSEIPICSDASADREIGALPLPIKEGYTFAGWYTAPTGGTLVNEATKYSSLTNNTVYARWTANTYKVVYNGNGSTSGTMSESSHTYDSPKALTSNAFTRKYTVTYNYNGANTAPTATSTSTYTFAGWATSTTGNKVYDNGQTVSNLTATRDAAVNLYAKWSGGSITLPTPVKTGFDFSGWYSDSSLTTKVGDAGDSYTPITNITLYAKWGDATNPTCTFNVTTSGITMTTSDNVGVTKYGLTTTNTRTYNSTSTASLSNGTFYGWVEDAAGNQGTCSVTIGGTKVTEYTKTSKTCAYQNQVASGTYTENVTKTCTTSTCSKPGCSCTEAKASGTYVESTSYACTTSTCSKSGCSCTVSGASGTYSQSSSYSCTSSTCGYSGCSCSTNASGSYTSSSTYSCTTSTCSKSGCSCSYTPSGTYTESTTKTCTLSTCGKSGCTCTNATASGTYTESTTKTCTTSTCSKSGCSCTDQYAFGTETSETVTTCSANTVSTCNASNNNKTNVTCTPKTYACADSSYTKLNNTYCYKID